MNSTLTKESVGVATLEERLLIGLKGKFPEDPRRSQVCLELLREAGFLVAEVIPQSFQGYRMQKNNQPEITIRGKVILNQKSWLVAYRGDGEIHEEATRWLEEVVNDIALLFPINGALGLVVGDESRLEGNLTMREEAIQVIERHLAKRRKPSSIFLGGLAQRLTRRGTMSYGITRYPLDSDRIPTEAGSHNCAQKGTLLLRRLSSEAKDLCCDACQFRLVFPGKITTYADLIAEMKKRTD